MRDSMAKKPNSYAAMSVKPTHGTAKQIAIKGVIPQDKREAEVFWVKELIATLEEFTGADSTVISNPDDSDGQDDVYIEVQNRQRIGVQVTEYTWELERARKAQCQKFVENALKEVKFRKLSANPPIVANCLLSYTTSRQIVAETISKLVDTIEHFISEENQDSQQVPITPATVVLSRVMEGTPYSFQQNGIAVSCNLDSLPRSLEVYNRATDLIYKKKCESNSDWLVIWSSDIWRDKHWLGDEIVKYMRELFANSGFERVYFIESLDGEGLFSANLCAIEIKA